MYIELFLFDNILMDLIMLRLAEALVSVKAGFLRELFFAVLGSVLALLGAVGVKLLLAPLSKLLGTLIISLALPGRGLRARLLAFTALAVSAAAVGGAAVLVALMLGGRMSFGALYCGVSLRVALVGAALSALLPRFIRRLLARRIPPEMTAKLRIELDCGECIECAALIDTGNALFEGASALPVIVLNELRYAQAARTANIPLPIRTASGESVLYALKPKSVFVNSGRVDALIAFSRAQTALVPPSLIGAYAETPFERKAQKC